MIFKDYYKILGLETNKVTTEQIRVAYREQAKKFHPDVNVGNKNAEESIQCRAARLSGLLEFGGQKGLFGNGGVLARAVFECDLRHRRRRARPRGPRDYLRNGRVLSRVLLYAERAEGAGAHRLSHALGGRVQGISQKARPDQARRALRRFKRRASGDRPEESVHKPQQRRIFRSGARAVRQAPRRGLRRQLPLFPSGRDRRVQLVELYRRGAHAKRRLANRLFRRVRAP